jgi:hypothetical protein
LVSAGHAEEAIAGPFPARLPFVNLSVSGGVTGGTGGGVGNQPITHVYPFDVALACGCRCDCRARPFLLMTSDPMIGHAGARVTRIRKAAFLWTWLQAALQEVSRTLPAGQSYALAPAFNPRLSNSLTDVKQGFGETASARASKL